MAEYQVLARKYRPQIFSEVLGQEAIVTTLKNAIKFKRLAHAYLFCGSRGTGKTTLARVFAKALNCLAPADDGEPCNACPSCKEIAAGYSLDVLEIDGASHRGIDDIRQINETVGYAASSGKYKIYIIDEVHMLTKEAFNALLKTLEEPPTKVMFLFATTEPHKVLPTILSRCQRFNLNRIPIDKIVEKLRKIAQEQKIDVEEEALRMLALRADGGLRDAESLFDQIIAFHEGRITAATIAEVLGIVPKDVLFSLDSAGKSGNLSAAFDFAYQIFSQGKDVVHFVESLTEHFRTLLLVKLSGSNSPLLPFSDPDKARYEASAKLYTQEQCLTILDFLIEAQSQIRFQACGRIALEALLLRILRIHQRLPIEFLVRRLAELEQTVRGTASNQSQTDQIPPPPMLPPKQKEEPKPAAQTKAVAPTPNASKEHAPQPLAIEIPKEHSAEKPRNVSEDPTPTPADLGIKAKPQQKAAPSPPPPAAAPALHKQSHYDTLLQFAAVELEGTVQRTIK